MRVKCFVYQLESTAISFHLNISLKREEPFRVLWCSTQLLLNTHKNFEYKTPRCFPFSKYISKLCTQLAPVRVYVFKSKLQNRNSGLEHLMTLKCQHTFSCKHYLLANVNNTTHFLCGK